MMSIGLLSDTHGNLDDRLLPFFDDCDEIWHAGDIGHVGVYHELERLKPVRAVYGNIDGHDIRSFIKASERFFCEEVDVWLTHIGGYPGKYDRSVKTELFENPPDLFICGHSHILKVMHDEKLSLLHINPGAAGKYGFHQVRTAVRFKISGKRIHDLQVLELKK